MIPRPVSDAAKATDDVVRSETVIMDDKYVASLSVVILVVYTASVNAGRVAVR